MGIVEFYFYCLMIFLLMYCDIISKEKRRLDEEVEMHCFINKWPFSALKLPLCCSHLYDNSIGSWGEGIKKPFLTSVE